MEWLGMILNQSCTTCKIFFVIKDVFKELNKLFFSDGTEVSEVFYEENLKDKFQPPLDDAPANNCVGLIGTTSDAKFTLIPCEEEGYYNFGLDLSDPNNLLKPGLGYICEAKIIPTIPTGKICHFPFKYNGQLHDSCSFEPIPGFNPDGLLPWCALEVDENNEVKPNRWALCKDERDGIYVR